MAVQLPLGSTTEDHEKTGYLTRTSNGFGWQMNILDEYGELFVDYVRTCKRPIADLGVAYGYTSKQLLAAGAYVIANDLSPKMLDELRNSVRDDERKRLVLMPGMIIWEQRHTLEASLPVCLPESIGKPKVVHEHCSTNLTKS